MEFNEQDWLDNKPGYEYPTTIYHDDFNYNKWDHQDFIYYKIVDDSGDYKKGKFYGIRKNWNFNGLNLMWNKDRTMELIECFKKHDLHGSSITFEY